MNEELLNLLREIADPAKCKMPRGWATQSGYAGFYLNFYSKNGVEGCVNPCASPDYLMDILGRLMRAIEGEGQRVFGRQSFLGLGYCTVEDNDYWPIYNDKFTHGDVAGEALALARCIRAACAVEVADV